MEELEDMEDRIDITETKKVLGEIDEEGTITLE